MMRAMYSGITGLKNFQTVMDIVGNNIANVNTVGFKALRVTFQTALLQTLKSGRAPQDNIGGTNPMQIGLGSQIASIDKLMTQGSFQNTGKKMDLAIQGDGFFILSNGSRYFYTRAGNFDLDMNGTLIQASTGLKLQGWVSEVDPKSGKRFVDTNKPIGDIIISAGMRMDAKKTTEVRYDGNLNADVGLKSFKMVLKDNNGVDHEVRIWFTRSDDISSDTNNPFSENQRYIINIDANGDGDADQTTYVVLDKFGNVANVGTTEIDVDPSVDGEELTISSTGQFRFYESDNPTNFHVPEYSSPRYSTSVQVYYSLGNPYNLYIEFLRLGYVDDNHKNVWIWRAYLPTGESIRYLDSNGNEIITALGGAINFDESGKIVDYGSITGGTTSAISWGSGNDVKYVQFDTGSNGDGIVKIQLDFSSITQFAGESSVSAVYQDGNALGVLESFAINEAGEIIGTFSNGLTDVLGKIALAVFNNPAGLKEVGNSLYVESPNSGIAKIGEPGTGGRGSLIPGALEMSNVDLAEEFTRMIIAQRGFQANARVITTADAILGELVALRR